MLRTMQIAKPMGLGFVLLCVASGSTAQQVEDALGAAARVDQAARSSQARIDEVVDDTRDLIRQYQAVTKELDGLNVYNALFEKQVENQRQEISDLQRSMGQVSVIERQVMPLMTQMVESLGQFVELDVPFLLPERRKRVVFLRTLLERSDVTVAEKVRRVLEAYEIENDYGRTIEAYKGSLQLEDASREVDFLRVGRIALLYQTADAEVYGMWDRQQKKWAALPAGYRNEIRQGLKVARKQTAPNLLLLPIPAPEAAR